MSFSSKSIIRGASVKGVLFCGGVEQELIPNQKEKDFWQKEGEKIGFEEGYQKGLEEGFAKGIDAVSEEIKQLHQQLKKCADQLKNNQENLFEEGKAELIAFCMNVCEHLFRKELIDPNIFKENIERILECALPIIKECPVEIFLSKKNHTNLVGLKKEERPSSLRFLVDDSLLEGDCRLETPFGLVNFDLKRLLKDAEQKALERSYDAQPCQ